MTDEPTMTRAADLQPGDFLDFEDDPIVDVDDHCSLCGEPAYYSPDRDQWFHGTSDGAVNITADKDHIVSEVPRDVSWQFNGALIDKVYTPESYAAAAATGEHDQPPEFAPVEGQVLVWTTDDQWIGLPEDHRVKLIERRGTEPHEGAQP